MTITKFAWVAAVSVALVGCGSSEETIVNQWATYCDATMNVDAENCPADMDNSGMGLFCTMVASSFYDTPECRDKLDALIACNSQRQWACWEGGEVPMVVEPDPCESESAAFVISNESPGECVDSSTITTTQG